VQSAAALIDRWNQLPPTLRRTVVAVGTLLIAISIFAAVVGHSPKIALFATPLRSEQLNDVEEQLAQWNVAFTPTADNVVVDADARNQLLLKLSLSGVPRPHVATSDETLSNVGVLTPQAVIDAQARSGLAGDIEVGLRGIDGIDDARVIVAPAKSAEFADQSSQEASASVRLQLHQGATLGAASVLGIRQFVAASVPGLQASHVTILDDRGVALDDAPSSTDADALERSLQSALDTAFGAGVTLVRVRPEFNRQSVERREVRRQPLPGSPIATTLGRENYQEAGKHYSKADESDDRGSDVNETVAQSPAGSIARISTAVFVDESHVADIAAVRALAAATVGYDARRGDTLDVEAVAFRHDPTPKQDGWWLLYGAIVPLLPALVSALGAIVVARIAIPPLAGILRKALARATTTRVSRSVTGHSPAQVRGALLNEPPHAAAAIISALPAATAAAVLELYPPHERDAIVRRMQRAHSPFVPNAEEVMARHA
jgi:flagellar M-ring protein FliF